MDSGTPFFLQQPQDAQVTQPAQSAKPVDSGPEMPSLTEYLQNNYGATVDSINPDNTFSITRQDASGKTTSSTIDARAMLTADLKRKGIVSDASKIPLSSPEAPVGESSLPFLTQYNLAKSVTQKDKYNYLTQELGSENVRINKAGNLVTKTPDGIWSNGKTNSTLASIVSSEGGALAGMTMGASIGSALGPVGAIVGSGIGAVLGKATTLAEAYGMGMRTEGDAKEITKELGKEFLYGLAGEAPIAGIGALMEAKLISKAISKVSKATTDLAGLEGGVAGNAAREQISALASSLSGVEQPVSRFALDNPEMFRPHFEEAVKYAKEGAGFEGAANPVFKAGEQKTLSAIDFAEKRMTSDFGKFKEIIDPVVKNTYVLPEELLQAANPKALLDAQANALTDTAQRSLRQLSKRFAKIGDVATTEGIPLEHIMETTQLINDMLSPKMAAGMGMNDRLTRSLMEMKTGLQSLTGSKLSGQMVDISFEQANKLKSLMGADEGKLLKMSLTDKSKMDAYMRDLILQGKPVTAKPYDVGQLYNYMNGKYAARSDMFELLSKSADPKTIGNLYGKLTGPTGQVFRDDLANLLTDVGMDGKAFMKDIYARKAAVDMAPIVNPSRRASGPIAGVANMVGGRLGTSPRYSGQNLLKLGESSFMKAKAASTTVNAVSSLSPTARGALLKNPDALKAVIGMGVGEEVRRQNLKSQLIQHGQNVIKGK